MIALYSVFTNASKIVGRILLIIHFLMLCNGAEITPQKLQDVQQLAEVCRQHQLNNQPADYSTETFSKGAQ